MQNHPKRKDQSPTPLNHQACHNNKKKRVQVLPIMGLSGLFRYQKPSISTTWTLREMGLGFRESPPLADPFLCATRWKHKPVHPGKSSAECNCLGFRGTYGYFSKLGSLFGSCFNRVPYYVSDLKKGTLIYGIALI